MAVVQPRRQRSAEVGPHLAADHRAGALGETRPGLQPCEDLSEESNPDEVYSFEAHTYFIGASVFKAPLLCPRE